MAPAKNGLGAAQPAAQAAALTLLPFQTQFFFTANFPTLTPPNVAYKA